MSQPGREPGTLEQILRLQETLLVAEVAPEALGERICQGAALLTGAGAARLACFATEGGIETLASYGYARFDPASATDLRRALAEGRPALHHTLVDGTSALTVPLQGGDRPVVLQLAAGAERSFDIEHVALARMAGAIATTALRQAGLRERLERAAHTKSQVLVALSHDLRSPLNVVIGYTRLLLDDAYGTCTGEQREVLANVERYAVELLSLLSGALDLARLDLTPSEARREEFALADVLRELCTGSLSRRVAAGVELTWHVDASLPMMHGDRFRVRQILQNLVDNALRFTEHGTVSVAAVSHEGGVRLTVADTGPGIRSGDLAHLFEPFRPGANSTRPGGGTGCGLYLVKRFSESLRGRVAVDSTPGQGTRFTVDLPLT
jgi:signal transduction histidine kinase